MYNKRLIVGKNSKIVNKIKNNLDNVDLISHNQLSNINFDMYEYIYIFSWSHKSLKDNELIIDQIPKNKIIFISSVVVLSNFKRKQWNAYPVNKRKIEKVVLKNNGTVIRFGIFDDKLYKHNSPVVPYTSFDKLENILKKKNYTPKKIYDCFELYETKKHINLIENFFYILSLVFSKFKILRIGIEFISKYFIKSVYYGYSADTLCFFSSNLQIGYGAIGSSHKKYIKDRLVITSNKKDKILNTNGFNNTYIGYDQTGLSKYWHGVYLSKNESIFKKKVPIFVRRKRSPFRSLNVHIEKISYNKKYFTLISKRGSDEIKIYGLRVIFAAGILENIRLLRSLCNKESINLKLNDHEWFNLGLIDLSEAINKKFLIKFGFLIFRHKLYYKLKENFNILVEFRPFSKIQHNNQSFKFYSDIQNNIFIKLFKNLSLDRLNEAIYNKFGISFTTQKIILTALINNKNCIEFGPNILKKERLSKGSLIQIRKFINDDFNTFNSIKEYITFDAQHINGGEEILNEYEIKTLIKLNKIYIAGFPASIQEDDFYPTQKFILKEKSSDE